MEMRGHLDISGHALRLESGVPYHVPTLDPLGHCRYKCGRVGALLRDFLGNSLTIWYLAIIDRAIPFWPLEQSGKQLRLETCCSSCAISLLTILKNEERFRLLREQHRTLWIHQISQRVFKSDLACVLACRVSSLLLERTRGYVWWRGGAWMIVSNPGITGYWKLSSGQTSCGSLGWVRWSKYST